MGINDINVVLGQDIDGSCYVSDKFGALIGWYDYNLKVLHIDERYKHIEKLLERCIKCDFQYKFCLIENTEVLKYFAQKRLKIKEAYYEKKKRDEEFDEKMKLMPGYKKGKKVINAEQKIKDRHG